MTEATTSTPHVRGLRSRDGGREYPIAPIHVCEWDFAPLEVVYDYDYSEKGFLTGLPLLAVIGGRLEW